MTHPCIKCKRSYEDDDPDPYYCDLCREANKKIAEELSQRFVARPVEKSTLQMYEEAPKFHGFPNAKNFMI